MSAGPPSPPPSVLDLVSGRAKDIAPTDQVTYNAFRTAVYQATVR